MGVHPIGGLRYGRPRRLLRVSVLPLLVFAGAAAAGTAPREWRTAEIPGAQLIGSEDCLSCHDDPRQEIQPAYHQDCESCHGPGSKHADSQETADIRFPAASDCLACHEEGRSTHLEWRTSDHARAGLICADCHELHGSAVRFIRKVDSRYGLPDITDVAAVCVQCHREVAMRLSLPSHHPIREGQLSCVDCHDPHGDTRTRLGDQSDRCAGCHQELIGPWVFEHPPAVEDCTICHAPHGSPAPNLLRQIQPIVCLQCHSLADSRHQADGALNLGRDTITEDNPTGTQTIAAAGAGIFQCANCHGAIHGSHFDRHLRR